MLSFPEPAVAISGLPARADAMWKAGTADACAWVRDGRIRGIALDAARPDCRARELGRSARRDLAAMVRRAELELAGIDLWIPPEHFLDDARAERAFEAVRLNAELAAELARLVGGDSRAVVSVQLPPSLDDATRAELGQHADRFGAVLADHTPGPIRAAPGLVVGVDPAACIMAGESAGKRAVAGGASSSLRLSDMNSTGRCAVGSEGARLDLKGYAGACLTVGGVGRHWITIDTRGIHDPARGVAQGLTGWRDLVALPGM